MNVFDTITIWPEEPVAPEEPQKPDPEPPKSPPFTPWEKLQIEQNQKIAKVTELRRIEKIGGYYDNVVGEIDWAMEGIARCRVKGAPCYGRDYEKMNRLKKHLSGKFHKVCIFNGL